MPDSRKGKYEINSDNTWMTWGKHVLTELKRLNDRTEKIEDKLNMIEKDIVALKIKSGLWGALAGSIPGAIILILVLTGAI